MTKKILFCASTASHILNFHLPYLQYFKERNCQVDVLVAKKTEIPYTDNVLELPMVKRVFAPENLRSIYTVKKFLTRNHYDLISTHTTLAGAIVRLAIKMLGKRYRNIKVVHTSHGYFFNGLNSFREKVYLWVEMLLAPVTDILMVMNNTDYDLALKYKLGQKVVFIPGMGVDLNKFTAVSAEKKASLKKAAGFDPDDFLIVYAAEMSKRKNQGELIRAFFLAARQEESIKLLFAGEGELEEKYRQMASEYGLDERVIFLGHVSDMANLYALCDAVVSTSRSEGLPFNIMEAMACGLPVIASKIKGHMDLLSGAGNMQGDLLYDLGDEQNLANILLKLQKDKKMREQVGMENKTKVQSYGLDHVKPAIINVYTELM